ncbi:MAG: cation diffusion facilitator family transporter [Candidatus Promineifilaceae bacterium]|nr:cation diffusion facilitator family transporter [Candidatus Promineifilaceae bacterium]
MLHERHKLTHFAWLSIATALVTMGLKLLAFMLTGSVGLLSDALESSVNLLAAIIALIALVVAAQPPDEEHAFGHGKAEYFSTAVEGGLILVAALTITISAAQRLLRPQPLEEVGAGLVVSLIAAGLNFVVARVLVRAGEAYDSTALLADGRHLLADVWTSLGVVLGVGAVGLTGWQPLDPLIALAVAVHIVLTGVHLMRDASLGLMDTALPVEEVEQIVEILESHQPAGVAYHALRTRRSGAQRFVSVHIQVPGAWTVQRGHTLLEEIEGEIRAVLPRIAVFTHLEPAEDPISWEDISLNRSEESQAGPGS